MGVPASEASAGMVERQDIGRPRRQGGKSSQNPVEAWTPPSVHTSALAFARPRWERVHGRLKNRKRRGPRRASQVSPPNGTHQNIFQKSPAISPFCDRATSMRELSMMVSLQFRNRKTKQFEKQENPQKGKPQKKLLSVRKPAEPSKCGALLIGALPVAVAQCEAEVLNLSSQGMLCQKNCVRRSLPSDSG